MKSKGYSKTKGKKQEDWTGLDWTGQDRTGKENKGSLNCVISRETSFML